MFGKLLHFTCHFAQKLYSECLRDTSHQSRRYSSYTIQVKRVNEETLLLDSTFNS